MSLTVLGANCFNLRVGNACRRLLVVGDRFSWSSVFQSHSYIGGHHICSSLISLSACTKLACVCKQCMPKRCSGENLFFLVESNQCQQFDLLSSECANIGLVSSIDSLDIGNSVKLMMLVTDAPFIFPSCLESRIFYL